MRSAQYGLLAGVLILIAAVRPPPAIADSREPDAASLVGAVRKSENWVHEVNSLYLRIESKWTTTPEDNAAQAEQQKRSGGRIRIAPSQPSPIGILEYVIDHQHKRVRYLTDTPSDWYQLKVWDGKQLTIHERSPRHNQENYYLRSQIRERTFHEFMAVDTSWPRAQPHSFWFDPKDTKELLKYWGPAEDFVLTGRTEYRGLNCYVLDCDRSSVPDMTPDLVFRWYVGVKDTLLYGISTLRAGKLDTVYWMSDYREIAPGCWFPMAQAYELYSTDEQGKSYLRSRRDLKVVQVDVNKKLPDELFRIELKEGIQVADERSGKPLTYTYKPEPPGLVGKALPPFEGIEIDFATEKARGKMVLVCFWDMNQRPSRNCIMQLAKQAQQLKGKGVTVVVVQASQIDEKTLNEWVKENNIPFPVGMIQDDSEKIRFAWGVQSLPWLILSDPEHIVRAEGFALSDLDEKIKENEPSANTAVGSDKVTGLVRDPEGRVLPNVRVTEFQTDKEYITDTDGKFVSAFGLSGNTRYFFAVHRQRKLVGVGQLPAGQRQVEIDLVSAKMVSGTVVDPDGKPVAGAQVAPLPMTCFYVLTDNQGGFDVGWNPEWAGDLKEFFLFARHQKRNLAALVYMTPQIKTVDVKLEPALTLTGTITDPNDKPISGATIGLTLHTAASASGWGCGTPVGPTYSDDNGCYEFKALPQRQEWIIYARADGYVERGATTGIINTIVQREDGGQIILKRPVLSVSGIVVDSTGKPVANIQVGLRGEGQPERTATTDAQGKFTLEKICVGSIEIWAKLGSVLYGTVEAQAGRKDVKLVVLPIR